MRSLWRPKEVAEYLGVPVQTLYQGGRAVGGRAGGEDRGGHALTDDVGDLPAAAQDDRVARARRGAYP